MRIMIETNILISAFVFKSDRPEILTLSEISEKY